MWNYALCRSASSATIHKTKKMWTKKRKSNNNKINPNSSYQAKQNHLKEEMLIGCWWWQCPCASYKIQTVGHPCYSQSVVVSFDCQFDLVLDNRTDERVIAEYITMLLLCCVCGSAECLHAAMRFQWTSARASSMHCHRYTNRKRWRSKCMWLALVDCAFSHHHLLCVLDFIQLFNVYYFYSSGRGQKANSKRHSKRHSNGSQHLHPANRRERYL